MAKIKKKASIFSFTPQNFQARAKISYINHYQFNYFSSSKDKSCTGFDVLKNNQYLPSKHHPITKYMFLFYICVPLKSNVRFARSVLCVRDVGRKLIVVHYVWRISIKGKWQVVYRLQTKVGYVSFVLHFSEKVYWLLIVKLRSGAGQDRVRKVRVRSESCEVKDININLRTFILESAKILWVLTLEFGTSDTGLTNMKTVNI